MQPLSCVYSSSTPPPPVPPVPPSVPPSPLCRQYTPSVSLGNPNEPTAAEVEAEKTSAINERRTQTIARSRAKTQVAEGSAAVPRR